jgi:hypothetical protein
VSKIGCEFRSVKAKKKVREIERCYKAAAKGVAAEWAM